MKKQLVIFFTASIVFCISVVSIPVAYANKNRSAVYKDAEMTQEVEHTHSEYKINSNGQTYGIGDAEYVEDLPDLISAMGDNGILGYIYTSELLKTPSSPKEAVAYQKKLDNGEYIPRTINVYESDGKTVIDTLTETLPDTDKIEIRKK